MENHDIDIHELNSASPDFHTELAKQLQSIVPEAIIDGKVDVIKLSELLQEDTGDTNERFGLFWPGKKRAMRAAQEPTTATLKPAKDLSKDWDTTQNIFIEGDNLEVLKLLQKQYHSSIKMIYIDPPYNTGKDFVYPDNFQEGLQNYLEFSKQVDEGSKKISTNTETAGRYHSNWLNMMYPRLKLARNLLTDDGVIFISIDDAEQANLKKVCDEIFGEDNFVASIIWEKKFSPQNDTRWLSDNHDFVLLYARNKELWSPELLPRSAEMDARYKNPDNDQRGVWTSGDLLRKDVQRAGLYTIKTPSGRIINPPSGRSWRVSEEKLSQMISDNRIWFGEDGDNVPRIKRFLSDVQDGVRPITIWKYSDVGHNQEASQEVRKIFNGESYFDTPKPTRLLRRMLEIAAKKKDSLVLDFFSGSGTTAHAVMQLNAEDGGNRRHIQVQLPEPTDENSEAYKAGYRKISDIARERINRAGEKIKADFADKLAQRDTPFDIGYRAYKLSDTNFTKWQSSYTADVSALQQRLDLMRESSNDYASEQDLLTEIMLKIGLPLITKVEPAEIDGLVYYRINDSLLVYLNEKVKPSLNQLRSASDKLPSKIVILEDAFQGDDQLKTNLHQICKINKIELWTI